MTFLGWLSDPCKGLSDLQLGDKKVTLNHLVYFVSTKTYAFTRVQTILTKLGARRGIFSFRVFHCNSQDFPIKKGTPQKTNIASKNNGLEDLSPFRYGYFWVSMLVFGGVTTWEQTNTLLQIIISHQKSRLKMIFLFPRWDMLVPRRVILSL